MANEQIKTMSFLRSECRDFPGLSRIILHPMLTLWHRNATSQQYRIFEKDMEQEDR